MLSPKEIEDFVRLGYIKLERVFTEELAAAGRAILWKDTGSSPEDPSTWRQPVVRLGEYGQEPFRQAANMPALTEAFDQLVGKGRWFPRQSLGTFPVRFPHSDDPGDTGWHAEASFYGEDGSMRLNVHSKGRALLMLFLFSDIGEDDAPTKILEGSHLDVPPLLAPAGEEGMTFIELAQQLTTTLERSQVLATGDAGTVYLCHPFLVDAEQPHKGRIPRFLAQPPLIPREPLRILRDDEEYSPVERAIRMGLDNRH